MQQADIEIINVSALNLGASNKANINGWKGRNWH